jgi:3-hydroxymyristoyl/3-hydroxydecanoyl-(acyl carrier protein) dehydratase
MRHQRFILEPDAACLDGHFPGRPLIPGVVLLDAAITAFGLQGPLRIVQAKQCTWRATSSSVGRRPRTRRR